jgi:hypothetical protein
MNPRHRCYSSSCVSDTISEVMKICFKISAAEDTADVVSEVSNGIPALLETTRVVKDNMASAVSVTLLM